MLRLAYVIDSILGRKKLEIGNSGFQNHNPSQYNPNWKSQRDNSYFQLSERIDELESQLNEMANDSDLYDDIDVEIELLRNELE